MSKFGTHIKTGTCIFCVGLGFAASIAATHKLLDCRQAICRSLDADLPHSHDKDRSPSPGKQNSTTIASSSGSGLGRVHHLQAEDLVTGSPKIGSPELRQVHNLTALDLITGAPVIGSPTLTERSS